MSVVAVGAEEPLAEHMMVADFFREWLCALWGNEANWEKTALMAWVGYTIA